ncbi:MAG: hypothetical protein Q9203_001611 [Teloschistes exilis]
MWSSGDRSSAHPRKDHDSITPTLTPCHGAPTSFFLATESMLRKSHGDAEHQALDSTYGVRSLPEASLVDKPEALVTESSGQESEEHDSRRRSTLRASTSARDPSLDGVAYAHEDETDSPLPGLPRLPSTLPSVSSLSQDSQGISHSLPSSPKSTSTRSGRPSEKDSVYDGASQAVASSEDEADIDHWHGQQDLAPQLIMPSIQMPSRRPFTERGQSLGRLKILLAGDTGLGKTSLIKSIVQLCEDIVHVDPVSLNASSLPQGSRSAARDGLLKVSNLSTSQLHEVWASTKAYPGWWTELEDSRALRRRSSIGEPILERNICFVDTPGYGQGLSITEGIQEVTSYIEAQLARSSSASINNGGEMVNMLSGIGGAQVDVVLYLLGQEIKPADLDFVHHLTQITNVIPLLAQADLMSAEDIEALKSSLRKELARSSIKCFTFASNDVSPPPYAICSAPSNDQDNMDASLLMASDYIQPLLPSELGMMIDHLFAKDNLARLRYLAAKKLVRSATARQLSSIAPMALENPLSSARASSALNPNRSLSTDTSLPPLYSHQCLASFTQLEEGEAQSRLARWARELRKTPGYQYPQVEELQPKETSSPSESVILSELASNTASKFGMTHTDDPLGLLYGDEFLRHHGWKIFQVVGTFGVFGAVAVWMMRNWSTSNEWAIDVLNAPYETRAFGAISYVCRIMGDEHDETYDGYWRQEFGIEMAWRWRYL